MKLHWHKLSGLSAEWRQNKPEIYIMLMIVKKAILESGELESLMGKVTAFFFFNFPCIS